MPHLIRLPTETWQELDGIQEPFSIRQFRGVSKLNPMSLDPGYATDLSNLSAEWFPSLQVRCGTTRLAYPKPAPVTAILPEDAPYFLAIVGGDAHRVGIDGSVSPAQTTGLSTTARWSYCNFKGNFQTTYLIAAGGDYLRIWNGATLDVLTSSIFGSKYIESYANRLYTDLGRLLLFSAINKADDWSTESGGGSIMLESPDGGVITGIKSMINRLVVFTRENTFELYGTGPENYRLVRASANVGCLSHYTIVHVNGVMRWLGPGGIYEYDGGWVPRKDFSLPVQGYVERITKGQEHKACAITDGKRYFIALPIDGSTEPNIILEYDPTFGTWMVWHMPANTLCMASKNSEVYFGLEDGRILKLDLSSTTDDGQAIPWSWESPPIGSGSYATRKRWYDMWIVVDLPAGSTLDVYLSDKAEGDDSWTLVRSLSPSTDLQSTRIILPINTIANANWVRVRLVGTGPAKVHELSWQERILPGWRV